MRSVGRWCIDNQIIIYHDISHEKYNDIYRDQIQNNEMTEEKI